MEGKEKNSRISNVLIDCYEKLTDKIFLPERLATSLYSRTCINEEELSRVVSLKVEGRHAQTRQLLDILITKDERTLDAIIAYFVTDETQLFLVQVLEESIKRNGEREKIAAVASCSDGLPIRTETTWWPERKPLIRSFLERAHKNGRSLVEYLHSQLHSSAIKTTTIVDKRQAVVGMGGIGKTTTAKWYANQYEQEYEQIYWIDSEGEVLENSVKKLAKALFGGLGGEEGMRLPEVMTNIYHKLSQKKCLFIFDNANCYDNGKYGLVELLPTISTHHAIITSRNQDWGNESEFGIPKLELGVYSKAECIGFLRKALKPEKLPTEDLMEKLGHEVGFLPLALHCAVATINKSKFLDFASYLERLTKDMKLLIDKSILTEYERSISATLQISIGHIEQDEDISQECRDLCKTILHMTAYCEPDNIPIQLFYHLPNIDQFNVNESIDVLLQYSLLSSASQTDYKYLNIHRLLQQVLRSRIGLDSKLEIDAISITLQCVQGDMLTFRPHCLNAWTYGSNNDTILRKFSNFAYQLSSELLTYHHHLREVFVSNSLIALRRVFSETDACVVQLKYRAVKFFIDKAKTDETINLLGFGPSGSNKEHFDIINFTEQYVELSQKKANRRFSVFDPIDYYFSDEMYSMIVQDNLEDSDSKSEFVYYYAVLLNVIEKSADSIRLIEQHLQALPIDLRLIDFLRLSYEFICNHLKLPQDSYEYQGLIYKQFCRIKEYFEAKQYDESKNVRDKKLVGDMVWLISWSFVVSLIGKDDFEEINKVAKFLSQIDLMMVPESVCMKLVSIIWEGIKCLKIKNLSHQARLLLDSTWPKCVTQFLVYCRSWEISIRKIQAGTDYFSINSTYTSMLAKDGRTDLILQLELQAINFFADVCGDEMVKRFDLVCIIKTKELSLFCSVFIDYIISIVESDVLPDLCPKFLELRSYVRICLVSLFEVIESDDVSGWRRDQGILLVELLVAICVSCIALGYSKLGVDLSHKIFDWVIKTRWSLNLIPLAGKNTFRALESRAEFAQLYQIEMKISDHLCKILELDSELSSTSFSNSDSIIPFIIKLINHLLLNDDISRAIRLTKVFVSKCDDFISFKYAREIQEAWQT